MSYLLRVLSLVSLLAFGLAGAVEAQGRRLAPSDNVLIRVINQPELESNVRVAPDGTISVPYVGRFKVSGLTEDQVSRRIKGSLESGGVVKNALVTVNIIGFGTQISILGAVRTPGAITLDRPTTVLEALSRAGGLVQNGGQIVVHRRTRRGMDLVHIDSKALLSGRGANPYVQNGDEIFVEEAPVYYLYGFVNRPGAYPLSRPVSVQQALANGGGLSELGSDSRIEIKRKLKDGKIVIIPGELDATVHPNDTIIVKERFF